jgi:hypothetical protein
VIDSDGTLVFSIKPMLTGGSKKPADFGLKHRKPILILCPLARGPVKMLRDFVAGCKIKMLNVAGSRASHEPTIADFVANVLDAALTPESTN